MKLSLSSLKILLIQLFMTVTACQNQGDYVRSVAPKPGEQPKAEKPQEGPALAGYIRSIPWKIVSGRADRVVVGRDVYMELRLWDEPVEEPCQALQASRFAVRANVPIVRGVFELGTDPFASYPSLFFMDYTRSPFDHKHSLAASMGYIEVFELSAIPSSGTAKIYIDASYPLTPQFGENSLRGWVEVPVCGSN